MEVRLETDSDMTYRKALDAGYVKSNYCRGL